MSTNHTSTDGRTEEGITVGLIDAIISIARVLAKRDLSGVVTSEMMNDLRSDEDVRLLTGQGQLARV